MRIDPSYTFDNREYLLSLFKMLKSAPKFNKHWNMASTITNQIRYLKREIRINTRCNSLCGNNKFIVGNMLYESARSKNEYWPESIKEAIKNNNTYALKRKDDYYFVKGEYFFKNNCFFIGDDIYDKGTYFLHDNKAYNRNDYYQFGDKALKVINKEYIDSVIGEWNISIHVGGYGVPEEFLSDILSVDGKKLYIHSHARGLTWDQAARLKLSVSDEMLERLKTLEPTINITFYFKNCRKKSHKFLRALLANKGFNIKELPTILEVIKKTLEI